MEKGGSMAQMKQNPSNVDGEDSDDNNFETKKAKLSLAKGKKTRNAR